MDAAGEERLDAALQVVQGIMQHEVSTLLFNVPVDPVALGIPDYLKVIKQPMVRSPALSDVALWLGVAADEDFPPN
jgi:hypothetical protein